jgi:hypothetical protein
MYINVITNIQRGNTQIMEAIEKETLHIISTIMEQNYFLFQQEYCKETEVLAMSPQQQQ